MAVLLELVLLFIACVMIAGPVGILAFVGICALYAGAQSLFVRKPPVDRPQREERRNP